jgi:glucose-6-phosphate isomerase
MPKTTWLAPFSIDIDLAEAVMKNPEKHNVRRASAMKGYYADEAALDRLIETGGDPLHYETFERSLPEQYGHLLFCLSTLQPGVVGDEFFMTKGHYHTIAHTGEVYLCLRGEGYVMMKTSDGKSAWERLARGRMVYVPPYWAHRSINTGEEPLTTFCVWPADAGHNYGDIANEGFPKRVFRRGGKAVIE